MNLITENRIKEEFQLQGIISYNVKWLGLELVEILA